MNKANTLTRDTSRNLKIILLVLITTITIAVIITNISINPFYLVDSGSMLPTLKQGDLVIAYPIPFESLDIGDTIIFHKVYKEIIDSLFIHRIVEIQDLDNNRIITTKGDYNDASLEGLDYPITKEDYFGTMIMVIPGVGSFLKILNPPVNYIIIGIILSVFLIKYHRKLV